MLVGRISCRLSRRSTLAQCRNSLLLYNRPKEQEQQQQRPQQCIPKFNQFHSLHRSQVIAGQVSLFHHSILSPSSLQRFSSSASQPDEKETVQSGNGAAKTTGDAEVSDQTKSSAKGSQDDLSVDDPVKLVVEKEELLKAKDKENETINDKVLRAYAEMENVKDRTRREAENSKKFAIQNFAKSLLDVADNMGRASSVVKDSFAKIDTSKDSAGAVPLLKTLLEGVEMTEKQLTEVFKKFGVEKFDPTNEQFDPHRHNAVFQVPDSSKAPNTVAVVLKPGYMLYDRIIRPAEVGVTVTLDNKEGSES